MRENSYEEPRAIARTQNTDQNSGIFEIVSVIKKKEEATIKVEVKKNNKNKQKKSKII